MKKTIWFEVTDGSGGNNFSTLKEAKEYLEDMKKGFPKNHLTMTPENKSYWKKRSKSMWIDKVVKTNTHIIYKAQ